MIWTRKQNRASFPQQGPSFSRAAWILLCLLPLFGLTQKAVAGTFTPGQTTFPATPVVVGGQSSASVQVTLIAQAAGTGTAPSALTEGVATQNLAEFAISDYGTCGTSPSLLPQQSCTVQVTFTPRFPGVRHGAITIQTSGGQLLASAPVSGVGQGPLPVLIPGEINLVAGNTDYIFEGDNKPATATSLDQPSGLAVDGAGNLYVADTGHNRIRRVDAATQNITTFAGNGNAGSNGDGGLATAAEITGPSGLALDGAGNLYIADTGNHAIRRVDAVSRIITTVAGTLGQANYTGDGGPATSATLNSPKGIALSPAGDLVIADTSNAVIRVVTISDGYIQTIAGTGTKGFNSDGIPAINAQLWDPSGVAVRSDGAIAVADQSNNRVRLFTPGGNISTVAGNGTPYYSEGDGVATQAELHSPASVVFDPAGDLLIADDQNDCIRLVSHADGSILTLAGTYTNDNYSGDGGPDNAARMHFPDGLFFDAAGNLWISDSFNNRVREVSGSQLTIGPVPPVKQGKASQPYVESMINAGNLALSSSPVVNQANLDSAVSVPYPACGQNSVDPSAFCSMAIEFAPTVPGTRTGTAVNGSITWNSNAPNVTPVDQIQGTVLSVEPTTIVIDPTSGPNPGTLNQSITLTATVTSADTSRSGTVDFVEGNYTWCLAVPLGADGKAACQIPSLSLGTHNFVANYSGDDNNAASQSPVFVETIKQQAALALSVSSSPAVVTSTVTLSINAVDANGTPATGTVIFYDGTTPLQTVTLDANGNASWSTSSLTLGPHVIYAHYSGDPSNVPEDTTPSHLSIIQASTVTVLSSANNDATVGTAVMLTANVVSNNGPAPTGTVQFFDAGALLGTGALNNNGSASLTVNTLTPGSHPLTAVYSGDTDDAISTSSPITQTIEQIGTATTLGADQDPVNAGATLTLTAIVSMSPSGAADGALSGTVTFHEGAIVLGSVPVNATGQASLALKTLTVGSHGIVATFNGNTNYAVSNSATLNEAVQQTPSAVSLSSASSTTLTGRTATFSSVVTSATGVPTGSVAFRDGATVLGTSPLDAHGNATFSTANLTTGNHSVTAVYSGDANYLSATSASLLQTVNLAQTALSLSGPTNAVDAGTTTQFLAALTSPGLSPTGTLTLLDGAASVGAAPVTGVGSFTFTTSRLAVGTHTITVSYSGDTKNAPTTSGTITVVVKQAPTTTALASSANPLTLNGSLLFTATVTSDSPDMGGSVSFFDGPTLLGTTALSPEGTATLQSHGLALGSHPITASYTGDTNHAGSTSVAVPELVVQSSSLTLTSSANPVISGLNVVFTGQVNGYPTPTGSATFKDNGAALSTVPLSATGAAVFSTSTLGVGTHTITVTYSGDNNFSVTITQLTETVLNATTQTALSTSANPAIYGQPLILSAAVGSNGGVPTGNVTFTEGANLIGSAPLDNHGAAVLTLATLSPGSHQLVANYPGDGKANASISSPTTVIVKQTTALAVASTPNPTQTLTPVTLVASITNPGAAPATGTVTFVDNGLAILGTETLDGAGHATLILPQLPAGTHAITATYAGDGANFASAASAYNLIVQLRPTTTTVTGTGTDASNPQQVTLIAVVKGGAAVPPSGIVNFSVGSLTLGAAAVDQTGVASITVLFNVPTQQVVASYTGDASYASSQSGPTPITAGKAAQFTVGVSTTDITVVSHQHTSVVVTLSSVKGFTDSISLGCLGLPYAATCTFDRSTLKLAANGTATATLLLDTGDPLGAGSGTTASLNSTRGVLACCLPGALLLLGFGRISRRTKALKLLILVLGLALVQSTIGCSGLQVSGTPVGTYTFRVIGTGQGSNTTEAQTVTLVVTQ